MLNMNILLLLLPIYLTEILAFFSGWRGSLSTTVTVTEETLHSETLAGEDKVPIQSIPLYISFVSGSWTARHCHDDSRLSKLWHKTIVLLLLKGERGKTPGWGGEGRGLFSQTFIYGDKGGSTASWFHGCRPAMTLILFFYFWFFSQLFHYKVKPM